ncbi:flagellar basal body rod protein FlgC [Legionella sp. W05-934-2]|jgi:flagellar basal-body rod protein FlgC|uniref:flagellar basal body rod protein FlgC n=1 Tax=Legionella sp. W05-934-2 TaxID=1198649 RepID=UPI0034627C27
MALNHIFNIAGTALTAETMRLTTSTSNITNANAVSGTPEGVYRAKYPIFRAIQAQASQLMSEENKLGGVKLDGIYESDSDPVKRYEPNNPVADSEGFVYAPNISRVEEMVNMISASQSYQMNLEIMGTAKKLMQETLHLGE